MLFLLFLFAPSHLYYLRTSYFVHVQLPHNSEPESLADPPLLRPRPRRWARSSLIATAVTHFLPSLTRVK